MNNPLFHPPQIMPYHPRNTWLAAFDLEIL